MIHLSKKEILSYILIILVIVLIRTFIVTPIRVNGDSMNDTLKDGDYMILKKYTKDDLNRFDIVVADVGNEKLIKRVIGLPDEKIEYKSNKLYINDKQVKTNYGKGNTEDFRDYCSNDEYFIMGDNRGNSLDSRSFGCISKSKIIGTTDFVLFPFGKWKVN